MINLIKKENLNVGILETDFDVFADIVNTFSSDSIKKECLIDLDDYIVPEYFKNSVTVVIQTNKMLVGYIMIEFQSKNSISVSKISKMYVADGFENKGIETLLIDSVIYMSAEVGCRNVIVNIDEHDDNLLQLYQSIGFYEMGMDEDGTLLSVNVSTAITIRKLYEKFRNISPDSIDYKSLKIIKKIASGRSGNIYLTQDGRILKMFTSTSFTYIKDREETLKEIKKIDIPEIVKPKNLVYYDGVFVGYIMEYLPEGNALWNNIDKYKFEKKLDKLRILEGAMKKLHDKKIYICDLNPDNIFFDKDGNVKLIDCDAFVVKENVINSAVKNKYRDPLNKVVGVNSDLYAFAIISFEVLTGVRIKNDANIDTIEKIYIKNKNKLPASFKDYFEHIFKGKERLYLTDFYEKYLNDMYSYNDSNDENDSKKGYISTTVLVLLMIIVVVLGLLVVLKMR